MQVTATRSFVTLGSYTTSSIPRSLTFYSRRNTAGHLSVLPNHSCERLRGPSETYLSRKNGFQSCAFILKGPNLTKPLPNVSNRLDKMTNTSITKKVEDIPVSERIIAATGLGDADDRKDGTGEQREDVTTQVSGKRERIQEEVGGKAIKRTKIEEAKERIANGNGCHQTNGTQSSVEVAYKAASKAHVKKKIFMPCSFPKPTAAGEGTMASNPALTSALSHSLPSSSIPTEHAEELAQLKEEFVNSLSEEMKELLLLERETMGDDWFVALRGEFVKPYFKDLKQFLKQEMASRKVFPPPQDVYTWSRLCPLAKIRVVVIGQDPYHNDGQAHGLAFSVRKGVVTPPSLKNMYKELETDIPGFKAPKHGDLTSWAQQGVLMLNTALTVRAHEAGSHSKKGWDQLTNAVLKTIRERLSSTGAEDGAKGVVFLAWGAHAGKLCTDINPEQHYVLKSVHPSPLSARRGFFGSKPFSKCNAWLMDKYGEGSEIDWKSVITN